MEGCPDQAGDAPFVHASGGQASKCHTEEQHTCCTQIFSSLECSFTIDASPYDTMPLEFGVGTQHL